MIELLSTFQQWLSETGFNTFWAKVTASSICVSIVILGAILLCFTISIAIRRFCVARKEIRPYYQKTSNLRRSLLRLLFFWILQVWLPSALTWNDWAAANAAKILSVIMAAMTASAICAGITFIMTLEKVRSNAKNMSYKVMVQIVKIITWCTTCIIIISILMDKSPVFILSGLGALTAVLMLIFKDSIVGLVAGIQVAQNDMVRVGDWITMPKFNADGNVIDIALTTVKVQNFDNTVTMIPSSALISDSFINWRYMSDSKGRRIKRPVWISATSIREMTPELKKNFVEQNLMLESDNHISNLAAFETWLQRMLEKNDDITKELTCMVRQTEPSDTGIPVEIYAFTKTRDWVKYENIQTEIFDLIYVTAPKFALQIYQRTGDKYLPNQLQP